MWEPTCIYEASVSRSGSSSSGRAYLIKLQERSVVDVVAITLAAKLNVLPPSQLASHSSQSLNIASNSSGNLNHLGSASSASGGGQKDGSMSKGVFSTVGTSSPRPGSGSPSGLVHSISSVGSRSSNSTPGLGDDRSLVVSIESAFDGGAFQPVAIDGTRRRTIHFWRPGYNDPRLVVSVGCVTDTLRIVLDPSVGDVDLLFCVDGFRAGLCHIPPQDSFMRLLNLRARFARQAQAEPLATGAAVNAGTAYTALLAGLCLRKAQRPQQALEMFGVAFSDFNMLGMKEGALHAAMFKSDLLLSNNQYELMYLQYADVLGCRQQMDRHTGNNSAMIAALCSQLLPVLRTELQPNFKAASAAVQVAASRAIIHILETVGCSIGGQEMSLVTLVALKFCSTSSSGVKHGENYIPDAFIYANTSSDDDSDTNSLPMNRRTKPRTNTSESDVVSLDDSHHVVATDGAASSLLDAVFRLLPLFGSDTHLMVLDRGVLPHIRFVETAWLQGHYDHVNVNTPSARAASRMSSSSSTSLAGTASSTVMGMVDSGSSLYDLSPQNLSLAYAYRMLVSLMSWCCVPVSCSVFSLNHVIVSTLMASAPSLKTSYHGGSLEPIRNGPVWLQSSESATNQPPCNEFAPFMSWATMIVGYLAQCLSVPTSSHPGPSPSCFILSPSGVPITVMFDTPQRAAFIELLMRVVDMTNSALERCNVELIAPALSPNLVVTEIKALSEKLEFCLTIQLKNGGAAYEKSRFQRIWRCFSICDTICQITNASRFRFAMLQTFHQLMHSSSPTDDMLTSMLAAFGELFGPEASAVPSGVPSQSGSGTRSRSNTADALPRSRTISVPAVDDILVENCSTLLVPSIQQLCEWLPYVDEAVVENCADLLVQLVSTSLGNGVAVAEHVQSIVDSCVTALCLTIVNVPSELIDNAWRRITSLFASYESCISAAAQSCIFINGIPCAFSKPKKPVNASSFAGDCVQFHNKLRFLRDIIVNAQGGSFVSLVEILGPVTDACVDTLVQHSDNALCAVAVECVWNLAALIIEEHRGMNTEASVASDFDHIITHTPSNADSINSRTGDSFGRTIDRQSSLTFDLQISNRCHNMCLRARCMILWAALSRLTTDDVTLDVLTRLKWVLQPSVVELQVYSMNYPADDMNDPLLNLLNVPEEEAVTHLTLLFTFASHCLDRINNLLNTDWATIRDACCWLLSEWYQCAVQANENEDWSDLVDQRVLRIFLDKASDSCAVLLNHVAAECRAAGLRLIRIVHPYIAPAHERKRVSELTDDRDLLVRVCAAEVIAMWSVHDLTHNLVINAEANLPQRRTSRTLADQPKSLLLLQPFAPPATSLWTIEAPQPPHVSSMEQFLLDNHVLKGVDFTARRRLISEELQPSEHDALPPRHSAGSPILNGGDPITDRFIHAGREDEEDDEEHNNAPNRRLGRPVAPLSTLANNRRRPETLSNSASTNSNSNKGNNSNSNGSVSNLTQRRSRKVEQPLSLSERHTDEDDFDGETEYLYAEGEVDAIGSGDDELDDNE